MARRLAVLVDGGLEELAVEHAQSGVGVNHAQGQRLVGGAQHGVGGLRAVVALLNIADERLQMALAQTRLAGGPLGPVAGEVYVAGPLLQALCHLVERDTRGHGGIGSHSGEDLVEAPYGAQVAPQHMVFRQQSETGQRGTVLLQQLQHLRCAFQAALHVVPPFRAGGGQRAEHLFHLGVSVVDHLLGALIALHQFEKLLHIGGRERRRERP